VKEPPDQVFESPPKPADMVSVKTASEALVGRNFESIRLLHGASFRDQSTIVIIPTRGTIPWQVVAAWQNLQYPMNQKRALFFAVGYEVGHAYNRMIESILKDPNLSKFKYVLTLEDDNIPTHDALIRLLETIETGFDAVGAIYFTKGEGGMPMAYGDPKEWEQGEMTFAPRNVSEALQKGRVMEVCGIAMGCSLWRMELFRQIPPPWYVTLCETDAGSMTQDLYFCKRAKMAGKRFAVDFRAKAGHLDVQTGVVY